MVETKNMKRGLLSFLDIEDDATRYVTGVIGLSLLLHANTGTRLVMWAERHDVMNPCEKSFTTLPALIRRSRASVDHQVYLFPEGLAETTESRNNGAIHAVLNDFVNRSTDVERHTVDLLVHGKEDQLPLMAMFQVTPVRRDVTLSATVSHLTDHGSPGLILFTDFRDEFDPIALQRGAAFMATEVMSMFHTETLRTPPEQAALSHALRRVPEDYLSRRIIGIVSRHFSSIPMSDVEKMTRRYLTTCTTWRKLVHDRRHAVEHAALAAMMPVFDVVLLLVIDHIVETSTVASTMHVFVGDGHRLTMQQMLLGLPGWRLFNEFSAESQDVSCFDLQTATFV